MNHIRRSPVFRSILVAAALSAPGAAAVAADASTNSAPSALDSHLEPLRPLMNKTWRGVFKNSKPEKPIVDVMRVERALNGRALRGLHSINDGAYGGETIYRWDEEKKAVTYHYFTTAGFMTVGTIHFEDGHFTTHEVVSGNGGGATEAKATCEFLKDGGFSVRSQHLREGKWEPGHETIYREDPSAKVIFR